MKVGDYVRTKDGVIAKIEDIIADYSIDCDRDVFHAFSNNAPDVMEIPYVFKDQYIIKSSSNIIDLIEVGDYVNGFKVLEIVPVKDRDFAFYTYRDGIHNYLKIYDIEEIKSIVTHEQFSQMEYRIGE